MTGPRGPIRRAAHSAMPMSRLPQGERARVGQQRSGIRRQQRRERSQLAKFRVRAGRRGRESNRSPRPARSVRRETSRASVRSSSSGAATSAWPPFEEGDFHRRPAGHQLRGAGGQQIARCRVVACGGDPRRDRRAVPRAARETGRRTTWGGWSRGQFTAPACAAPGRRASGRTRLRRHGACLPEQSLQTGTRSASRSVTSTPLQSRQWATRNSSPEMQRSEQEHRVLERDLRVAHQRAVRLEGLAQQRAARHGRRVLRRAVDHDGLPRDEAEQTAHAGEHRRLAPHARRPR